MTGFFNSRSGYSVKNYYYYVPSDRKLHDIGLGSYTRSSIEKFGKRKKNGVEENDPDINEYFSGNLDSIKKPLLGDSTTLILYRFDKDTKRYLYTTNNGSDEDNIFWTPSGTAGSPGVVFNSLQNFQEKFDLYQKGWIKENDDTASAREAYNIKYIWSKINNSMSGCISFNANGYKILGMPSSGVVNLFFQSRNEGSNRSVAFQPPVIAGVAKTATGNEHSFNISERLDPGVFSPPDVGGVKNPNNTVAGQLDMHFNRGTGKWESGTTQIYCQVLEDIPGVSIPDLPSNIDLLDNMSLRIPFASGIGMVMNTEKGNPHLCVPCSFGCGPSEKEKVVLVNRSSRSFTRGEMVLASQINGDWVPVPLANGTSVAKKLTIEWSQIQKYIVNAKAFFMAQNFSTYLDRQQYIDGIRTRFYESLPNSSIVIKGQNDLNKIKLLNLAKADDSFTVVNSNGTLDIGSLIRLMTLSTEISKIYYPNNGYLQFYDADILSKKIGGNNTGPNRLKNTIVKRTTPYDPDTGVDSFSVPCSWGMYFPDGYASLGVKRTIATKSAIAQPSQQVYNNTTLDFSEFNDITQLNNFNLRDSYFYHLPAQIALNSSSNQSIDINQLAAIIGNNKANHCDDLIKYIRNPLKGYFLATSLTPTARPVYGLTPINSTSVQFTPLSLELALSHTVIKDEGKGAIYNPVAGGYGKLKFQLNTFGVGTGGAGIRYNGSEGFFGYGIARNGLKVWRLESDDSVGGPISFGENLIIPPNDGPSPPIRGDRPDGGPGLLPTNGRNESSNVVGILAARSTFSLPNGGTIELKTDQKLGMLAYSTSTIAGGDINVTILGSLLNFSTDNRGQSKTFDIVQWGGSLGDEQYKELGTTALWCAIYDHCPNTVYDGRYFAPIQFNPSGSSVDFKEITLSAGTTVTKDTKVQTVTNSIRRNMLLSEGGFSYVKKVIGADPDSIVITSGGLGYKDKDSVSFSLGGKEAKFVVSSLGNNGSITGLTLDEELGSEAYGETSDGGTSNPFKSDGINASFPGSNDSAIIKLTRGKVIEKVYADKIQFYGYKKITKSDNNGQGDGKGFVEGVKTTTFTLPKNSTGKYDMFFFFVSDIANYPEAGVTFEGATNPPARYVNLEITSI